jgi:hypothetical protein
MAQNLIVALLVGGCFVYALWTLAPKALRRRLAVALLRLPVPQVLQKPLTAAVRQQGCCGCDGCDGPAAAQQAPVKPIRFVRGNYSGKTPSQ